jgi:hypothetical protein
MGKPPVITGFRMFILSGGVHCIYEVEIQGTTERMHLFTNAMGSAFKTEKHDPLFPLPNDASAFAIHYQTRDGRKWKIGEIWRARRVIYFLAHDPILVQDPPSTTPVVVA